MTSRSLPLRAAELLGLQALAVAQPVLALTVESPEFFILRKSPDLAVIAFALWLVIGIPVLVLAVEWAADRVREGAGWAVHLVALGLYLSLLALLFLKRVDTSLSLRAGVDAPGWVLLAVALAVSVALVRSLRASAVAHTYLGVLALAAPVVLAIFLLRAPIGPVTLPNPVNPARPAPVVVVVFDEFPAASLLDDRGGIDRRRMPEFARLAATSTWFSSATTVADETFRAVPAALSGRRPSASTTDRPSLRDWPTNVFSLLRGTYAERSLEPATRLCPDSACGNPEPSLPRATGSLIADSGRVIAKAVAPADIADDLPPVVGEEGTLQEPTTAVNRFLARVRPRRRPPLLVMHVMLPHHPWRFLPSGRRYPTPGEGPVPRGFHDPLWTTNAQIVRSNWRRHLLQAGYADTVLGRILRRLHVLRMFDRSLVVVVADHGISFEPGHEMRRATAANLGAIAPVPLFVKLPHERRASRITRPAETIDILPTILDVIGAPGEHLEGRSLLAGGHHSQPALLSSNGSVLRTSTTALLRQRWRIVREQASLFSQNRGR
jgi:hypothetical protein